MAPQGVPPYPGANPYGGAPASTVPYGQPYGTQPPSLFPQGLNSPQWTMPSTRFLTPRMRYTWISDADGPNDLGINDFDFSAAMAFPNFLYSNQPLYVVPSFSLHLWSGPRDPAGDLPPNAYSAFLDFGWATDPAQQLGGEIGVRVGVFTDFNTFNTNSGRIMGQGLFRLKMTPTLMLRGGVVYLDRNKIKLLPAGGLLWTPNSETRFDIFFPKPKLSQRLTTIGNQDVWWYVAGEYGGGAWTIQRSDNTSDRIDINDIRLILGAEWGQPGLMAQGRRVGFVEAGWVTHRELIYVETPDENVSIRDAFMVRAGFNY
jgi:hypothetical protein